MDLHKSYELGFRKAAEACGVDPDALIKTAGGSLFNSLLDYGREMDPVLKRALIGSLVTGVGSFALSGGNFGRRLRSGLLGGLIGGAATYGIGRSGLLDNVPSRFRQLI